MVQSSNICATSKNKEPAMSLLSSIRFSLMATLMALATANGASAQASKEAAAPVFLGRSELESALIGRVWLGSRGVYGAMTQISYFPDHRIEVQSVDTSTTRKGSWEIDDRGQLCVTWGVTGGTPACYLYARNGAKLVVYEAGDRVQPHAELQPKKSVN